MLLNKILVLLLSSVVISLTAALEFQINPTSEILPEEKSGPKAKRTDSSSESGQEVETDPEEVKEKNFLDDAMRSILDPSTTFIKSDDDVENFKSQLKELDIVNITLDAFMKEMDKLSLEVCKTLHAALWSYATDMNNSAKKNKMVRIAAEDDEIKKQYWNIISRKYINYTLHFNDAELKRKIRIIKERGINVQMPQSKQREEIDTMQRIWSTVTVCEYNSTCDTADSIKFMNDIISIFKTSNDTKELAYYWKEYYDKTGKKIRPIFKEYVTTMNKVAEAENFTDAGDMWRYIFDDDHFIETIERIWNEIKPFYKSLHDYVHYKLKINYKGIMKSNDNFIPAHLLGNLWAQEWQAIYPKVTAYPNITRSTLIDTKSIKLKDLFDAVDQFHQSLGFDSAGDSYENNFSFIQNSKAIENCLSSSHDMCDGVNYKIQLCGEEITDLIADLSRAAKLLGEIQYFKHYRNLPLLYRDGPNPAFFNAVSEIAALQVTTPDHLKSLNLTKVTEGPEVTMNHLLWLALEKFPVIAYAYVLDRWRWDVFGNRNLENWNEHWWKLRIKETGVSPPIPRNESDLDPAAQYHVVSNVQFITYLVSHVLQFQILLSLCKQANHTGPLHQCSIYGVKEAGKMLSDGMALGASEDWRTVLHKMTGETELSTKGILEYFAPLQEFLKEENAKLALITVDNVDTSAPIVVGSIVIILTLLIIILYCAKKHDLGRRMCAAFGLSRNGSLDIETNEMRITKPNESESIREDKV